MIEEKKLEPIKFMWTEKHRPKHVKDVVGEHKQLILKYLEKPNEMNNLLFTSREAGCGKTTTAKAIITDLGCDYKIINASDDRGIESVRSQVKEFAMTKSTNGKRKCIFMDEFDGLTKPAQESLRNIIEAYAKNVFFIFTCNNINKIHDALKSRCDVITFSRPDKQEIKKYLLKICTVEGLTYTEDGLEQLININYPSIRDCVVQLKRLSTLDLSVTKDNIKPYNDAYSQLYKKLIEQKDWQFVKKYLIENTIDCREFNKYVWQKALETVNIKVLQYSCRNERDISLGADAQIIVITSLIEMVK